MNKVVTLEDIMDTIPYGVKTDVYNDYGKVDNEDLIFNYKCKVLEIKPYVNHTRENTLRIYIDMRKVMPSELSHMAMIRALYEYIYCVKEEYVDFEPDADMAEMIADMHSFWGNSDYTIDHTGRWYDANGDRIF